MSSAAMNLNQPCDLMFFIDMHHMSQNMFPNFTTGTKENGRKFNIILTDIMDRSEHFTLGHTLQQHFSPGAF